VASVVEHDRLPCIELHISQIERLKVCTTWPFPPRTYKSAWASPILKVPLSSEYSS
jgi:hypothetical protein